MSRPRPARRAVVEIRAEGEDPDAHDFAGQLWRVLARACERQGWRVEVRAFEEGPEVGLRRAELAVDGSRGDVAAG